MQVIAAIIAKKYLHVSNKQKWQKTLIMACSIIHSCAKSDMLSSFNTTPRETLLFNVSLSMQITANLKVIGNEKKGGG